MAKYTLISLALLIFATPMLRAEGPGQQQAQQMPSPTELLKMACASALEIKDANLREQVLEGILEDQHYCGMNAEALETLGHLRDGRAKEENACYIAQAFIRKKLYDDAAKVIDLMSDPANKAYTWGQIAQAQKSIEAAHKALAYIAQITDVQRRDSVLAALAGHMAGAKMFADAFAIAYSIQDPAARFSALMLIARRQKETDRLDDGYKTVAGALAAAEQKPGFSTYSAVRYLLDFASIKTGKDDKQAAADAIALAFKFAKLDPAGEAAYLADIAETQCQARLYDEALKTIKSIPPTLVEKTADGKTAYTDERDVARVLRVLGFIIAAQARAGEIDIARQSAAKTLDFINNANLRDFDRQCLLGDYVVTLAESGFIDEADATLNGITDAIPRHECLEDLAEALAKKGQRDPALKYYSLGMDNCVKNPKYFGTVDILGILANQLHNGINDNIATQCRALLESEMKDTTRKTYDKVSILSDIAALQMQVDKEAAGKTLSAALELARNEKDPDKKYDALMDIAYSIAANGTPKDVAKTLAAAIETVKTFEPDRRNYALNSIVNFAAEHAQLDLALQTANDIPDFGYRVSALIYIAEKFPEQRDTILFPLLEQIKTLPPETRAYCYMALAGHARFQQEQMIPDAPGTP